MRRLLLTATLLALCLSSAFQADAASRPNVILFIADDVSWNDFRCYGNTAARTPHIDRLAARGLRFTEAYLTASSCSPSRSSIITGRYPHNTGKAAELHREIDARLPWFPMSLREAGYYTAIVGKHHMKSAPPAPDQAALPRAFDLVDSGQEPGNHGGHGRWVRTIAERPVDQPFFCWFASLDAHRDWDGDKEWDPDRYGPLHRPEDVIVPPFLADDPATRRDLASYYNEVTRFDWHIGAVVTELERQGILDQTLLLVLADNGRPFPRAKTRLHDSGMKTALVAHWPEGIPSPGGTTASLVSAIDIAPTILDITGVPPAETMQGVSFRPLFSDPAATVRRYAFSEHNWHDYEAHGRGIRADGFLFIRNHRPALAWQGPADSVRSPSHQTLRTLRQSGNLTVAQADVFLAPRPEVELYRTATDPDQLNNLADDPAFAEIRQNLDQLLADWSEATCDSVPRRLSADMFHRETGVKLRFAHEETHRGTTPGEDRQAAQCNAPGPR